MVFNFRSPNCWNYKLNYLVIWFKYLQHLLLIIFKKNHKYVILKLYNSFFINFSLMFCRGIHFLMTELSWFKDNILNIYLSRIRISSIIVIVLDIFLSSFLIINKKSGLNYSIPGKYMFFLVFLKRNPNFS